MKLVYVDVETTGVDPGRHEIWEVGMILEDTRVGKIDECRFRARPLKKESIDQEALKRCGVSEEHIMNAQLPVLMLGNIKRALRVLVNPYDREDRAFLVTFNGICFDVPFLEKLWKDNGDKYFMSWFHRHSFDVLQMLRPLWCLGKFEGLESLALSAVCKFFGVTLEKAHDALSDIKATRTIFKEVLLPWVENSWPASSENPTGKDSSTEM
jgi:DNA polymerase-3 subunit epsilon